MDSRESKTQSVRTAEGQVGITRAMPDDRVLVTLEDGRSFVVDSEQIELQHDGTYVLKLSAAGFLTVR